MKLKTSSTERLDRRYLLIRAKSKNEIEQAIQKFSGALGLAQASVAEIDSFKELEEGTMIIAINRRSLDNVRAAIELCDNVRVIRVSGTIKGLRL